MKVSLPRNIAASPNFEALRTQVGEMISILEDAFARQVDVYYVTRPNEKLPMLKTSDLVFDFTISPGVATLQQWDGTKLIPLDVNTLPGEKGDKGDKGDQGDQGDKGDTGDQGPQGEVSVRNTITGLPGTDASVVDVDLTAGKAVLDFTIPRGDAGRPGLSGAKGDKGDPGEKWFTGAGVPPEATGIAGDWWLDSTNGDYFEKTPSDSPLWQPRGNLKGPKGDKGDRGNDGTNGTNGVDGTDGLDGAPGEKWFTGAGVPPEATGIAGDWWLDSTNGDYFEKTPSDSPLWQPRGNLKGPKGDKGDKGDTGGVGATGPGVPTGGTTGQVLAKINATNFNTQWTTPEIPIRIFSGSIVGALGIAGATTPGKMCGFGDASLTFTPTRTGIVQIMLSGIIYNSVAGGATWATLRSGTGTPPLQGDAAVGSAIGSFNMSWVSPTANALIPVTLFGIIVGVAVGTQYWVDVSLLNTAAVGNVNFNYPYVIITEL